MNLAMTIVSADKVIHSEFPATTFFVIGFNRAIKDL